MEYKIEIYNGDSENRFLLGTKGNKPLVVMGINPSTADADKPDPTIRKVMGFAEKNGFDSFIMVNVYPQRATVPEKLHKQHDKIIMKENAERIKDILLKAENPIIVAAWGTNIEVRDYLKLCLFSIHLATEKYLRKKNVKWVHIGDLTKNGHPKHLLYQPYDSKFNEFDIEQYVSSLDANKEVESTESETCFITEIKMLDIPSSRNWKEIFDFAKTIDLSQFDLQTVAEQTIYLEKYFRKHNQIDSNLIPELRTVLFQYIISQKLERNNYPTVEQLLFMSSIVLKIHNIIYDKMWDER
jgi:hypothetical protein